ncbi:hypothetical protein ACH4YO_00070 [Streptomyces noursei]|uniref:hypothetical protein n=1 Tax=Streptomyces noursei TaxID=1971 RepID=UPI0033C27150
MTKATREELEAEIAALRAELKTMHKENQKLATEQRPRTRSGISPAGSAPRS